MGDGQRGFGEPNVFAAFGERIFGLDVTIDDIEGFEAFGPWMRGANDGAAGYVDTDASTWAGGEYEQANGSPRLSDPAGDERRSHCLRLCKRSQLAWWMVANIFRRAFRGGGVGRRMLPS